METVIQYFITFIDVVIKFVFLFVEMVKLLSIGVLNMYCISLVAKFRHTGFKLQRSCMEVISDTSRQ